MSALTYRQPPSTTANETSTATVAKRWIRVKYIPSHHGEGLPIHELRAQLAADGIEVDTYTLAACVRLVGARVEFSCGKWMARLVEGEKPWDA